MQSLQHSPAINHLDRTPSPYLPPAPPPSATLPPLAMAALSSWSNPQGPLRRSTRTRKPVSYAADPLRDNAPLRKRRQAAGGVRKNGGRVGKGKKAVRREKVEEKMTLAMRRGMGAKWIYVPDTEEWQWDEGFIGEAVRGSG